MTEVMRRPVPAWKIFAGLAVFLLISIFVLVVIMQVVASRAWARLKTRAAELTVETRARDPARPILGGEAVPGNAWDDYKPAIDEMERAQKTSKSCNALGEFIERRAPSDRAKVEELIRDHAGALDLLRRGARRAQAQFPYEWEKGFSANCPSLLGAQGLANLAACRARLLAEEGKPGEAAAVLLDTLQFGRDLGHNGFLITEMIAIAVEGIALQEMKDLVGKLSKDDLLDLDRALEALDRTFQRHDFSMLNERVSIAAGVAGMDPGAGDFAKAVGGTGGPLGAIGEEAKALASTWRYGFSMRLMMAEGVEDIDRQMSRLKGEDEQPWTEVERIGAEIQREAMDSGNLLVRICLPGTLNSARAGRERRAQLRLLRVAVHWRATGEVLEFDDPFGAKLLHAVTGGKLKVWSVARDGLDGGGAGGWRPNDGPDLVLEVER